MSASSALQWPSIHGIPLPPKVRKDASPAAEPGTGAAASNPSPLGAHSAQR